MLHRPGDGYSVWGFCRTGVRTGWYVNCQRPLVRRSNGIDTLDHGVDIVVAADGRWERKDREHVAEQVAAGRLYPAEAETVWRETVAALLDGDRTAWWRADWPGWRPSS
jgi:predicted RNA-binding protein associated with RNAse of E/G family